MRMINLENDFFHQLATMMIWGIEAVKYEIIYSDSLDGRVTHFKPTHTY